MKVVLVVIATLALSACGFVRDVSGGSVPTIQAIGDAIGAAYVDHPAQQMMARYGAPIRQMPAGNRTVYSWDALRPLRSTGELMRCQLDAYVSADGNVVGVNVSGQTGACAAFIP